MILLGDKGITFYINEEEFNKDNNIGIPALAMVDFEVFSKKKNLHEELFGPFSLVVKCNNDRELEEFAVSIQGQLTVSIFANDEDVRKNAELFAILREKAGRIIVNGVPTGVEVCPSVQHGGPFPASTDSRFTSVGTEAIKRFVRPVAFQNAPKMLLPDELKDENPLNIWRKINGEYTKSKC
jgi:NADP-dependent aldehyde dehydrogenase